MLFRVRMVDNDACLDGRAAFAVGRARAGLHAWWRAVGVLVLAGALIALAVPAVVAAQATSTEPVRWSVDPSAPSIGLIGDSTLSGVRWADRYGALERFNFLFDAESCRRTIEESCWSREQYRAPTALTALETHVGEWGEVLVVMSGYNDSSSGFRDGVEAIVEEARRQEIGTVMWLSLRTKGVDYEEPLHLANGSTYREANRSLYELADDFEGDLQIADWATYSADHPEWFEADGAHLAPAGIDPLTSFIAAQVDIALAGGSVTPTPTPWEEVRDGDQGELVSEVQRALMAAGIDDVDVADGEYGPQTVTAVSEFQRSAGLAETGAVDEPTAVRLGLLAAPIESPLVLSPATSAPTTVGATNVDPPGEVTDIRSSNLGRGAGASMPVDGLGWWTALIGATGLAWVLRRRARRRLPTAPPDRIDEPLRAVAGPVCQQPDPKPGSLDAPYDRERESASAHRRSR